MELVREIERLLAEKEAPLKGESGKELSQRGMKNPFLSNSSDRQFQQKNYIVYAARELLKLLRPGWRFSLIPGVGPRSPIPGFFLRVEARDGS
jgi:hypothetical protein